MENRVDKKIYLQKDVFEKNKSEAQLYAMVIRYWISFFATGTKAFLHRANYELEIAGRSGDMSLIFLRCLIAAELKNTEYLETSLEKLRPLRAAMKNGEPIMYSRYLYFMCLNAILTGKERQANKHYRNLEIYCIDTDFDGGSVLLAMLNLHFGETADALQYLESEENTDSPFFYVVALSILKRIPSPKLMLKVLRWSLQNGIDIRAITERDYVFLMQHMSIADAKSLYSAYGFDWTLQAICRRLIAQNDVCDIAFYYYKEACIRQLDFDGIYEFLIRAAYESGIEDINRYAIVRYLAKNPSLENLAFIYHILLKNPKENSEIIELNSFKILQYGHYALENRFSGRYYNSIYVYLIKNSSDSGFLQIAENIIKDLVFSYEIFIENPKIKKLLVKEDFRRQAQIIDIKSEKIRIGMADSKARLVFFDADMRSIISYEPKLVRLVENADIELLQILFERKHFSIELLKALCDHFFENTDVDADFFEKVLEKAAANPHFSQAFSMKITAALGNLYARRHNFKKAVQFYKEVNENLIDEKNIEQILLVYINAQEMDLSIRLITKKHQFISDKNLFHAIKRIVASPQAMYYGKSLSYLAYGRLALGWYDKNLLEYVLEHMEGSLSDWIKLSRSLIAMGVGEPRVDYKILEMAINMRIADAKVTQVFCRMVQNQPDFDIILDFTQYLSYEIMVCGNSFDHSTIMAMESVYLRYKNELIALALAIVYIEKNMATYHSERIMSDALAYSTHNGIIFPIFKEIKDKNLMSTYIDKNSPFLYHSSRTDKILLHYRIAQSSAEGYSVMPMKYLGFGIFFANILHFYNEELEYYFERVQDSGSIAEKPLKTANNTPHLCENEADAYYAINQALIHEQAFKYDAVEAIISKKLRPQPAIRGNII